MRRFETATPPGNARTEELRLALVCYGGVSLAIWMHGVTKELQALVEASEAFDAGAPPPSGTGRVYHDLLAGRAKRRAGVRTRVVVDIVAGTSAGGINGIVLAKALARGLNQDPVTRVWLEEGDLKRLMRSWPRFAPWPGGKALAWIANSLAGGLKPPLNGDRLLELVDKALDTMDADGRGTPVSPNNPVELHVTMTDFQGYDHAVPAYSPSTITDRRHRHSLSFYAGEGQFDPEYNDRLAFAARATSSFPGAFDPVRLADLARVLKTDSDGVRRFMDEQWRIYALSGAQPDATQLVDGGVLDNAPFKLAIQAIQDKPAANDVRRRLVFIQPDPPRPQGGANPDDDAGFAETIWGTTNRLPRREPMLDDLLDLRAFNERVERVESIITNATARETAEAARSPGTDPEDRVGFAYTSYAELKLHGVVESMAATIWRLCRFPRQSNHAAFVRAVLLRWGRRAGLLATGKDVSDAQERFLRTFDLDYRERRLRYVIRTVSRLYPRPEMPDRAALTGEQVEQLNLLKQELYDHVGTLRNIVSGLTGSDIEAMARRIFTDDGVAAAMAAGATPDAAIEAFLDQNQTALREAYDALATHTQEALEGFGDAVEATIERRTAKLPEAAARAIRSDFERFPYWDVLLYPIRRVSETAELDPVRVSRLSPFEATLLADAESRTGPQKLEGVKAGHFGAFFSRKARENDYLWGRLDAAEWIARMLVADEPSDEAPEPPEPYAFANFRVILDQSGDLTEVTDLRGELERQVNAGLQVA